MRDSVSPYHDPTTVQTQPPEGEGEGRRSLLSRDQNIRNGRSGGDEKTPGVLWQTVEAGVARETPRHGETASEGTRGQIEANGVDAADEPRKHHDE